MHSSSRGHGPGALSNVVLVRRFAAIFRLPYWVATTAIAVYLAHSIWNGAERSVLWSPLVGGAVVSWIGLERMLATMRKTRARCEGMLQPEEVLLAEAIVQVRTDELVGKTAALCFTDRCFVLGEGDQMRTIALHQIDACWPTKVRKHSAAAVVTVGATSFEMVFGAVRPGPEIRDRFVAAIARARDQEGSAAPP